MEILHFPPTFSSDHSVAWIWERLHTVSVSCHTLNCSMTKFKAGSLLLEVGQPLKWQRFEVLLAGSSTADLGLYYYSSKTSTTLMGCIRLQRAHIDSLEDVLMVVTNDKSWFLCANTMCDAIDWNKAIRNAIEYLNDMQASQLHSTEVSTSHTLSRLQSCGSKAQVTEFLNIFVRSSKEDLCLKALKGALSYSCMRSLVWKVWLNCLPDTLSFNQWVKLAHEKRLQYEKMRSQHLLFQKLLRGKQTSEEFLKKCENTRNNLLYNIYKDVRRTRGELSFFRHAFVQCVMIRVLYVYSITHPDISYNQGMGELLATLLYLLHTEQWSVEDTFGKKIAEKYDFERNERFNVSSSGAANTIEAKAMDSKEDLYCRVERPTTIQHDDTYLNRDTFFQLRPFTGSSKKFQECCYDAVDHIVRTLTMPEFIEHDAFFLLEEMMVRMAGTYRPHVPISRGNLKPEVDRPLSSADQLPPSPLDHQLNHVHHQLLRRCDPQIANHLAKLDVEPQLFLLRWIRVLMAREFEVPQVWQIWDAVFALTPSDFSFINVLCVAIVQEYRDEILAAEDATTVVLRLRNIADRIEVTRLVDKAYERYDALLVAAAIEASVGPA